VLNLFCLSFHMSKLCWEKTFPELKSETEIRPGAAMMYGAKRLSAPPLNPSHVAVRPVLPIMSIAPMPSAGDGFRISIGAEGKAQKLPAIGVSPASVWKGDWLSRTRNDCVEAV